MVKVLGVIFVSLLIVWKELPPLKRQKKKKEMWIFTTLQLFATTILSLVVLEVKIPSPLEIIRVIYKPISDVFFSLLT